MPEPLKLTLDTQTFYLCARDENTTLSEAHVTATKTALRRAQRELSQVMLLNGMALSELGSKEFGAVDSAHFTDGTGKAQAFYDIMYAAFRLPFAKDKYGLEDYRRCLRHVQPMLKLLLSGLTGDGLVLADLEAQLYKDASVGSIGGYVNPPWYQKLAIRTAQDFRNFWEEGEVQGPIHLNLTKLGGDEAGLTRTLIHEATHKFGRTNDIAYYSDSLAPRLITEFARCRSMQLAPDPKRDLASRQLAMIERALESAGLDATGTKPNQMTAVQALNNADSHSYYIAWMTAHVSFD